MTEQNNLSLDLISTMPTQEFFERQRRWLTPLLFAVVIAGLGAIQIRIQKNYHVPGPLDGTNYGYCDFHNGIYWPAVATWNRVSPYGEEFAKQYPVDRATPFFLPSSFLIHLPFAWMPLRAGEVVYFFIMVGLLATLGYLALKASRIPPTMGMVLLGMLVALASRSGYGTLFSGYFTLELVVCSLLALQLGSRPGWGGFFLAIAACKPTYAIPLGLVMLARGHWRAVAIGVVWSLAMCLVVYLWLLPGKSFDYLLHDIQYGQSQHMADWTEIPEFSWTRVDITAVMAKWWKQNPSEFFQILLMLPLLSGPCWLIWRLRQANSSDDAGSLSGILALFAVTSLLYRHYYDLLLLVVPLFSLTVGNPQRLPGLNRVDRSGIAMLIVVALYNYLSTLMVFNRFGIEKGTLTFQIATSISGISTFLALVWISWRIYRYLPKLEASNP